MVRAAPRTTPTAVWSTVLAAAHRAADRDAVAWLLEAGAPEVVMLPTTTSIPPQLALCRRCIASTGVARGMVLRWNLRPPPSIVDALADVRSPAPGRQGGGGTHDGSDLP